MHEFAGCKILIADDDPAFRLMLRKFLEKKEFRVCEAADGLEAIEAFKLESPELVLMDADMPVMNGFDACRRIRDIDPDESCPLLILTAMEDDEFISTAFASGAADYVLKPIHWPVLEKRINYKLRISKATKALQASEEHFRAIVNNIPGAVYRRLNDASWTIKFLSEFIEEISGHPASDFIDNRIRSYASIIHQDDRQLVQDSIHDGVTNQQPYDIEYRIVDANKNIHWVYERGQGFFDNDDNLLWLDGTIFDITEHQQLEEQLLQAQKMEAIGTLVGGIAHDFNNVLAGIVGNIFLAKGEVGNNVAVIENLENVESLSKRAADMIKQLLTFSRKDKVQMSTFAIAPFFKEAFKLAQSAIPENIELSYNISAEDMLIQGNSTQLQQIMMNLLNNACDAVDGVPQPVIHCQLESFSADDSFKKKHPDIKTGNFARLTVSDNGHGIPQDQQDRIFEPFFTSKGIGKGTGLGLSMVFGAVQRHNGVIELESEEGKGSTFHIYLPLEEAQVEPVSKKTTEVIQGQGETILLVDDEKEMRSATGKVLSLLGYNVLEAANGEEGLKIFKSNRSDIDLLFTDLVMPIMGGLELAKAIRQLDENMPIIFATGYDQDQALEGDTHLDHSLVISKPFSFNKLSQLMRTILEAK